MNKESNALVSGTVYSCNTFVHTVLAKILINFPLNDSVPKLLTGTKVCCSSSHCLHALWFYFVGCQEITKRTTMIMMQRVFVIFT